jgi:hypothetical protein
VYRPLCKQGTTKHSGKKYILNEFLLYNINPRKSELIDTQIPRRYSLWTAPKAQILLF